MIERFIWKLRFKKQQQIHLVHFSLAVTFIKVHICTTIIQVLCSCKIKQKTQAESTIYHKTGNGNMRLSPLHSTLLLFPVWDTFSQLYHPGNPTLPFSCEVGGCWGLPTTHWWMLARYSFRSMFSAGWIKIQINETTTKKSLWQPRRKPVVIIFICRMWTFLVLTDFRY